MTTNTRARAVGPQAHIEPTYTNNGPSVFLQLANKEQATYHSWSCLCPRCLGEDYAICFYWPNGTRSLQAWRNHYTIMDGLYTR
jgi:hypothetical protein